MPHTYLEVTSNYGFPRSTEGSTTRGEPDFDAAMKTGDAAVAVAIAAVDAAKLDIPSIATLATKTTLTNAYLNKTILADKASAFTLTLFTPVAADLGFDFSIARMGVGDVVIKCPAGVSVDSSRGTGSITSTIATEAGWAVITLMPISTTKFVAKSAAGTWATGA